MRLSIAVALVLVLPSITLAGVCGNANGKPSTIGHYISLPARPPEPFFYYRLDDYVVLIRPKVLLEELNAWPVGPAGRHSEAAALRRRISASIPRRENTDLYSYILQDPQFWAPAQQLLIRLLEASKAAVIDTGGYPLQRLYAVHDQQKYWVATTIQMDSSKDSFQLIRQLQCIADTIPPASSDHRPE